MKKNINLENMTYEERYNMYLKETYRAYSDMGTCCICGAKLPLAFSHDPKPVRPESWYGERENRCCCDCNSDIVIPARLSLPIGDVLTYNILTTRYRNMNHEELRASFKSFPSMRGDNFITNARLLEICGIK